MSYYGFFNDSAYQVVDGNIVYASDLNNPMSALKTGISSLVASIQTGATIKTATDTGVVNAYVMSLTAAPTAMTDGLEVWLKPAVANTGPATLNLNDLGAKSIRTTLRSALAGGELLAGYPFLLKYVASVDAWLIVSDPGSTELDTTRTVMGGDGITIDSDADSIMVSVTDGGIDTVMLAGDAVTEDKIADGAVTLPKISGINDVVHNDIIGGNATVSGNTVTMVPCGCWDSTRTVWLETTENKTVVLPSVASTWYYIYLVKLVADGSFEFRQYSSKAGAGSDAEVEAYRYIVPWPTNSGSTAASAILVAGELWFDDYEDTPIASGLNPTAWTLLDLASAGFPIDDFSHIIAPPANSANSEYILYSSFSSPGKNASLIRGASGSWFTGADSSVIFIPVNGNGIYVKEHISSSTQSYSLLAARLIR